MRQHNNSNILLHYQSLSYHVKTIILAQPVLLESSNNQRISIFVLIILLFSILICIQYVYRLIGLQQNTLKHNRVCVCIV
jgi:hypothetical protein